MNSITLATTQDAAWQALYADAWPRAQAFWSRFLLLSPPRRDPSGHGVAHIDLGTRQIEVNATGLKERGIEDCLEAILAHEIGHHVRYPGTLAVHARMSLMERALLPLPDYSFSNLFTDLMINEKLGHAYKPQLVRIYQAFTGEAVFRETGWKSDPAFTFYMALYEELWELEPGALMGPVAAEFENEFAGYRADAQLLRQNLFMLGPNIYVQYLYFLSVLVRYIEPLAKQLLKSMNPLKCGCGSPTPEDWADALRPSAQEEAAIQKALKDGWFDKEFGERLERVRDQERRINSLPGQGTATAEKVPDIMAAWYRKQAERYLLRPPPQSTLGEAVVPTTPVDWELGDSVREIDWLVTLTQRGPDLAATLPLKREYVAEDEGLEIPYWRVRMEIYLDVSGSMPDPRTSSNAMTLASLILLSGALRAGGQGRCLLYSKDVVAYWQWCRSEVELSRFLMHYIGAGTFFPFSRLKASVDECSGDQPIRAIITDSDFDQNYDEKPENHRILDDAIRNSAGLYLLQHIPDSACMQRYRKMGAKCIPIQSREDYPRVASDLAAALFEGYRA